MSATHSDVEKQVPKSRISKRCAVEAGVSERVAHGVLWLNWPVTNTAREKVWRWALERRLFSPRDLALRPPRVREKRPRSPARILKDLEAAMVAPVDPNPAIAALDKAEADRRAAASAEFDALLEKHAREGT